MKKILNVVVVLTLSAVSKQGWAQSHLTELYLDSQMVEFEPTRGDITVRALWVKIQCHQSANPNAACDEFSVSGAQTDDYSAFLDFAAVEKNKVAITPHRIRFSQAGGGYLCIAIRAVFNEVDPQHDSDIYVNRGDRYSLLSFCTNGEPPGEMPGRFHFTQNRVDTFKKFLSGLSTPIAIKLKQKSGISVSDTRGLKSLEDKTRKLKAIVADLTLDNRALKEINSENW